MPAMSLHRFCVVSVLVTLAACGGGDIAGPELPDRTDPVDQPPATGAGTSANSYGRSEVAAEGSVTELPDGFRVDGTLYLGSGSERVAFLDADLRVEYDANGRVRGITGTAQVPSPHERIAFADPVQADVGLFSGAFLNRNRDLGIQLREDTDYFVYRVRTAFEMRIATGETGEDAVKPIVIRPFGGGEVLLIVDYRDPMYYVHGALDAIGAAGIGWSRNGRLPFAPWLPVAGLGTFEGGSTRTGTFPVFQILSVTGQVVDNKTTEVHFTLDDPFATELGAGYQSGFNGEATFELFVKGFAGIELPLARASGGVFGEVNTSSGVAAHAYVHGTIDDDLSWWPAFLPFRPANALDVQAFLTHDGDFAVDLDGQYGWELPFGTYAMGGAFHMSPDSAGITGIMVAGDDRLSATAAVTQRATTLEIAPPQSVLDDIAGTVQRDIGEEIADAQEAWEDFERATEDYEFELSLRGLRSSIPGMVDVAKSALARGIADHLASHRGTVYYTSLANHVNSVAAGYYHELNALKAAALDIRDNDATRAAIESALRSVAARRVFSTTYSYKVLGVTVKTVKISRRILTDQQAGRLLEAADDARYIRTTSDRKLSMRRIYDEVNGRELFEKVRDDIEDGMLRVPSLSSFGFELIHATGQISVFAVMNGRKESMGEVNPLDLPAVTVELGKLAVEVLLR